MILVDRLCQSLPQGQLRQVALRRCVEQRPEPPRELCGQRGKDRLHGFAWRRPNEVAAHQHQPTPVIDDALENLADDLFRPVGTRQWLAGGDAGLQSSLVGIVLVLR